MPAPQPTTPPVPHLAEPDALITHHLDHLRVQRRLAERTLAMYGDAFKRLLAF